MTDRELDRRAAHRLAVIRHAQEVTGNVSKTCRYYGITRQAYYKWLPRYEAGRRSRRCGTAARGRTEPERHPGRGRGQDRLPAPDLPLRAPQDRDVPGAVPRPVRQPVGDLADPQAPRHEPAAGVAAVPPPQGPLEALREAAAGVARPDRRQVHRAAARLAPQALPVHRDRRLHPDPRPARLRPVQPDDLDPVCRRGPGPAAASVSRRSRPTTARSSSPASTTTCSAASGTNGFGSGRTSTTSTARTAVSAARLPMRNCA